MTPAQTRAIAEHALTAIAVGAGLRSETVRDARDDATAPHAEIPAAALRRVWLWALAGVAPSCSAAALAAGVSRPTVRRACAALEAWSERDADAAEAFGNVAEMVEALAAIVTDSINLQTHATRAAILDRAETARRRANRPEVRAANAVHARRMRALAAEAVAAGAPERGARMVALANIPAPKHIRTRDLHRVRAASPRL